MNVRMINMMVYILDKIGSTHKDGQHMGLYKKRSMAENSRVQLIKQHIETYIKTYPLQDRDSAQINDNIYELQFKDETQCMSIGFYASEHNAWRAKQYYMQKTLFANKTDFLLIITHLL